MNFEMINSLAMMSIVAVSAFAALKPAENYPSAALGTRFIYYGFFVLFINSALFLGFNHNNLYILSALLTVHFIGLGSIISGGIKFKIKYFEPMPSFLTISGFGAFLSVFMVFVLGDANITKLVFYYSFAAGLIVLGVCFLLRPKMEKTGGYFITAFSLFLMAVYYILSSSAIGKQILATGPFEIIILALFIIGLVMVNGNLMWYQLEFLLSDIKKSKERLRLIVQASPFPIIISKLRDGSVMLINNKAAETFGISTYHPEQYKIPDIFADVKNHKDWEDLIENHSEVEKFEVALKKVDESEKFWMLTSSRIIDFDQEIALYSAFQDISDIKQKEERLFAQATRDPLTNCYNRRQFEELGNKEIYKATRSKSLFTIVMIDADHFKNINDTYGHATGDIVLKELAACCQNTLRETDIVARYGGEEFVILLPETKVDVAYTVCDRLREKIANMEVKGLNAETITFTVSMGLAESSMAKTLDGMVEVADEALYIAKQTGRNRLVIGQRKPEMDEIIIDEDKSIETEVKPISLINEDDDNNDDVPLQEEEKVERKKDIWEEDDASLESLENKPSN